MPYRREVPAAELGRHLRTEDGLEPVYRRAVLKVGLA
jgi:hypothetical protein